MHGIQCGGDDHGTEHTVMAFAAPDSGGMVHSAGASHLSATAAGAASALAANEPALRNSPGVPRSPLSPAGVCLVLLTAGLVLLLVALGLRRQAVPDGRPGAPSAAGPPVPIARPPSLAQLCLLRI
jgi:hypothetical protein